MTTNFAGEDLANFSLDDSYGYLINLAAQRLRYELHRTFQERGYDVTPEQWAVLNRLWEEDGLSQVELADRTFKDGPGTTRILRLLEQKGLVTRIRDDEDRRVLRVFLSEAGRNLREGLILCAQEVLARSGENLSGGEIAQLKKSLNQITRNLE